MRILAALTVALAALLAFPAVASADLVKVDFRESAEPVNFLGHKHRDIVHGSVFVDRIAGSRGPDRLLGHDGDDWILGQRGGDELRGGEGNDRISGGRGDDVIYCGPGDDTVVLSPGADVFRGCETVVDPNEPEPDPDPDPPTQPDIVQSTSWTCSEPQDRGLVKLTLSNGAADAIQFRSGCTGEIDRIEIEGAFADCLKVNPVASPAHDLEIGGGYCRVTGPPAGGAHQDCIQAGGGENFLIRNFVFDCIGGGGGNYFIASFNGGTPHNFICDHCAFGPRHPNQIRTPSDPDSGVMNSLVCESESGRATYSPASGDKGGNTVAPSDDPRCTFAELLAYVEGT